MCGFEPLAASTQGAASPARGIANSGSVFAPYVRCRFRASYRDAGQPALAISAIRLVGDGASRWTVDPLTRALGRIVARHRRARGYSWRRLGDQSGVSGNTVRNLERGERSSRVNIVAAIARGLEMPVWRLFREAEGLAGAMGRRARPSRAGR